MKRLNKKINSTIVVVTTLTVLYSCMPDENLQNPVNTRREGEIVLGKKLENPYSVKNMRVAYENIRAKNVTGRTKEELDIRATHLYVKFLPENYALYDTLTSDSTIYFVDHPIDYEIEQEGDFYHDPTIPDTLPTYQYTAVPIDYTPPAGIPFQILEELYLPKEDTTLTSAGGRISIEVEQLIDELEYEALNVTGNLPEDLRGSTNGRTAGLLPSKFTPNGTLSVNDTRLGIIRLAGAKVRTRRWFEVHEAITDFNGNYRMGGTYRYDFNYDIIWERADFDVRSGTFGQAMMDGPNCKCSWSPTINGGVQQFYASVFRGAHRYFHGNIDGLRRPLMVSKMKISAYDKNNDGTNGDNWGNWDNTGLTPDIRIWRSVNGRERDTDEIFSTTVHEIAHTTHIQVMNAGLIQFSQVSDVIVESWAVAVQWHVTSLEYRERGIPDFADPFYTNTRIARLIQAFQFWPNRVTETRPYTSLFIDIVDNHNQAGRFGGTSITDNLQGYRLANIESGFLKHVYGLSSLRERLKANKPLGVTDAQIDELINQY